MLDLMPIVYIVSLFIKHTNRALLGPYRPQPGSDSIFHRHENTYSLKACTFSKKQCYIVIYVDPANQTPVVKNSPTTDFNSSHILIMRKNMKVFLL